MTLKVSHELPPNWDKLVELFGADWRRTVVTYGGTVHCSRPLSSDLEAHEAIHVRQQLSYQGGPKAWWERYYVDEAFRLEQELEAHQAQYAFLKKVVTDRNKLLKQRDRLARELSGPLYGKLVTFSEAFEMVGGQPCKV